MFDCLLTSLHHKNVSMLQMNPEIYLYNTALLIQIFHLGGLSL